MEPIQLDMIRMKIILRQNRDEKRDNRSDDSILASINLQNALHVESLKKENFANSFEPHDKL